MTQVTLEFELSDGADTETKIAERLQSRLAAIAGVEDAETQVDKPRGIGEVVAIVSAGVVLLGQGTAAATNLKDFVRAVKELMIELGDFKRAFIEVRGRKIDVMKATDAELDAA